MATRGDDLEDDFIVDDIVALSEDEEEETSEGHDPMSTHGEEPESSAAQETSAKIEKKRKRREQERLKFKERKKRKLAEAHDPVLESSITEQPPQALADYLATFQSKTFSSTMSALELEDLRIPADSIADTSIWTGPRTLDSLVDFIIKVLPNLHLRLSQRSKTTGAPTLLFVAGAALRVVDVTRVLKDQKLRGEKGGEVAKLFAKHFKLAEHVTYLRRTKVGSAVGTPGRIGKLLCETDALAVNALSHIILDVSFRDAKNRNILDIPETRDEIFKTVIGAPKVLQAIKEGKIQVVLF
ncbi:U3-containing 90S pre-ribosomal complex subunit-domain containing protein [Mycena albidolilacea]|uniref:U3-containing 90S pre-ribosomal complex subunit-domain containing protein n=1 Tax=Mycena albidolilacea TaxID=1033008 RepID=A0AAD7A5S3_9AGAR|nr:U3-containing 90S pre-ribosomal complex subunit-domain containing protein [Mycena albidolilacea]